MYLASLTIHMAFGLLLSCASTSTKLVVDWILGGKAASDGPKWALNLQAVRAAIRFAMDTKRLDVN